MAESQRNSPPQPRPERSHGLLYNVFWGWPWALFGMLLDLLSLLIEYTGKEMVGLIDGVKKLCFNG